MIKAIGCFVFFLGTMIYTNNRDNLVPALIGSLVLFYVVPFVFGKMQASADETRRENQAQQDQLTRTRNEENEHQTALRRERERLEMHAEVRIKELIATFEVQFQADKQKMQQLTKMKTEFANRQQADLSGLLGRLEAMKAGA